MLTFKNKLLMTATVGLLSAGGFVATANAQGGQQMPPQGQQQQMQQQQQMNVSDAQLQEFAAAQQAVGQVQSKFQAQAESAETQEEMQTIQQQANEEMVQAIQETELSVQEYNQIANLVQADPQVQERYIQMVQ